MSSLLNISPKVQSLSKTLSDFVTKECIPAEEVYASQIAADRWSTIPPIVETLKDRARSLGLWNLFLPSVSGLSNLEYAVLCEIIGWYQLLIRSFLAPEATNTSAPDTGNMEVLNDN
jgi:alkylation response protein AidB-like acyl-CoA dehydrogenase